MNEEDIDYFAKLDINPVTDFIISSSFPNNEDDTFYRKLIDILITMAFNVDEKSLAYVDSLIIKCAQKIKNKEDYIN